MATPRSWSYVLLSPVRGRENVLAKYPVAHPVFPVWEGIEEGVVASHHVYIYVSFGLSVIGGGSPVGGGKHGHLKCRLGNEREKEGARESQISYAGVQT